LHALIAKSEPFFLTLNSMRRAAKRNDTMPTGKFIVKSSSSGGIRFNLHATNGQIIATSDSFADMDSCLHTIEVIRVITVTAGLEDQTLKSYTPLELPKFEIYRDKAGEFRFRLKGESGKILLVGEGYKAKASCQKGIQSIRKNAPVASLEIDLL
jgi:uncharacterized protein YegP (UPF0339 family)